MEKEYIIDTSEIEKSPRTYYVVAEIGAFRGYLDEEGKGNLDMQFMTLEEAEKVKKEAGKNTNIIIGKT